MVFSLSNRKAKYNSQLAVRWVLYLSLYSLWPVSLSLTCYIPWCWGLNTSCRMLLSIYTGDLSATVTKYQRPQLGSWFQRLQFMGNWLCHSEPSVSIAVTLVMRSGSGSEHLFILRAKGIVYIQRNGGNKLVREHI